MAPQNADGFVNWLDTMLQNALGHPGAHRAQIRIYVIHGVEVCRLDGPAAAKADLDSVQEAGNCAIPAAKQPDARGPC